MLSNAYFLAKFRFGTAENEPAKNLQNFAKINLPILLTRVHERYELRRVGPGDEPARRRDEAPRRDPRHAREPPPRPRRPAAEAYVEARGADP